jgi:small subunit ribosomal protein S17
MPKKKSEEQEVEATNGAEAAEETPAAEETATAEETPAVEASAEETAPAEEAAEPSLVDEVVETVSAAAETVTSAAEAVATTVAEGVSSVVNAVTGAADAKTEKTSKRAERIGIVQSDKMTKTVVVRVDRQVKHPIYRKYIKRRKKFMAHDELGAGIGDKVRIIETRPLSARKRWRVVEIIQKAEK